MYRTIHRTALLVAVALTNAATSAEPNEKQGKSPLDELPPYVTRATHFGQRADWSHDGKRILFIEKTFGDVYEIELATRDIRPMTHHYYDEEELIFSAYGYQKTEVMGLNLKTGEVVDYSQAPEQYDEPEGIFPDGRHTLVECDAHNPQGSQYIDIYKLALDGSGAYERITFFGDYPGYKASNPVVSDDGRYIAFQYARLGDKAGIGHGILIMDLKKRAEVLGKPANCSNTRLKVSG